MENKFSMVAKTFQGLEDVLRDELISLGAENVEMGRRMVSFEGDLALMYRANISCRTALRILKPIEKFTAEDPDELYDIVRDIDWEKYMTPQTTFAIDSTVNSEEFTHSRYVTYRVKDGIVDHFQDKYGKRPSISVSDADIIFNVHIFENRVTISLDSSGESLSKRGYRVAQTPAPINEVLAAGIIMKTGWRGDCNFADPMCGSGTFLIEAALIAANINPGIYRRSFAFEKWPDFNEELFEEIYNDDSAERDFNFKIYGGDISPDAVAIARKNIKEAKVEEMIELTCRPFSDWTDNPDPGVLVMNPPYGERLKPDDISELYRSIGSTLKKYFSGWHAWIIGLDGDEFNNIGLKPSLKIPLLNGSLECVLREYVLFNGSYNDFRADGGIVSRYGLEDEEEMHGPKKMRHLSDDEWNRETKKFGHSGNAGKNKKNARDKKFDRDKKNERKRKYDDVPREFQGREERPARDFRERDEFRRRDERPAREFHRRDERQRDDRPREFRKHEDFRKRDDSRKREDRSRDFRKERYGKAVEVKPQGPKISAENAYKFSDRPMRSRKKKNNFGDDQIVNETEA